MVLNIASNIAGTSQISGSDIIWAGGNNITLSATSNGVTIIGPNTVAQTVQTQASGNIVGAGFTSTTTAGTAVVATHNSAGLSMGVPAFITTYAAQTVQTQASGNIAGAGFTSTTTAGTAVVATHNSAGLSIGVPAFLTTAGATNAITTAASSNHSHNFATTTTGGSNIVVGTANSVGATIGVPAFLTTAAATNVTSGRAGTGTTFAGTNATATLGVDTNGMALSLSVAGGGVINQTGPNIAVAGSTITSGDVVFSNSNGVTFGMNGSTITASVAGGGGGGVTVGKWEPFYPAGTTTSTPGQNSIYMQRLQPDQNVSFYYIERRMSNSAASTTAGRTAGYTIDYGLYSRGAGASSTQMTLMGSSQILMAVSMNSSTVTFQVAQGGATYSASSTTTTPMSLYTGLKHLYMPFTNTLSAGQEYWFAQRVSSSGSSAALRLGFMENTVINNITVGKIFGSTLLASNASYVGDFNQGVFSATSSVLPATAHWSQLTNAVSQARMYLQFDDGV
jgi:hypothetical protein